MFAEPATNFHFPTKSAASKIGTAGAGSLGVLQENHVSNPRKKMELRILLYILILLILLDSV
jgi:hypothetical protein